MIDMSRSMFYNGASTPAKRIALALDSLIRSQYPARHPAHRRLLATSRRSSSRPICRRSTWNEYQVRHEHAARIPAGARMLAPGKGANKQIIIITDGEPTAHIEDGQVYFSYPPTPRTLQETLKEVIRCTRDGIKINTFMLERSAYLMQFVNDLMRRSTAAASSSPPRTISANTSWSTTSPTSGSGSGDRRCHPTPPAPSS